MLVATPYSTYTNSMSSNQSTDTISQDPTKLLGRYIAISSTSMHPVAHGVALIIAIGAAFWWLSIPALDAFTPQLFAVSTLIYFLLKKFSKAKFWHILPSHTSLELVVASFAILILIGSTGNISSPFYALTYIHLFLLVFSTGNKTSTIALMLIMIFHTALSSSPQADTLALISHLVSLPVLFFFFLFAKSQYLEVIRERNIIASDEVTVHELQDTVHDLTHFLESFSQKKLLQIKSLLHAPQENSKAILGQLSLLELEIERKLSQLRIRNRSQEQAKNQTNKET